MVNRELSTVIPGNVQYIRGLLNIAMDGTRMGFHLVFPEKQEHGTIFLRFTSQSTSLL